MRDYIKEKKKEINWRIKQILKNIYIEKVITR